MRISSGLVLFAMVTAAPAAQAQNAQALAEFSSRSGLAAIDTVDVSAESLAGTLATMLDANAALSETSGDALGTAIAGSSEEIAGGDAAGAGSALVAGGDDVAEAGATMLSTSLDATASTTETVAAAGGEAVAEIADALADLLESSVAEIPDDAPPGGTDPGGVDPGSGNLIGNGNDGEPDNSGSGPGVRTLARVCAGGPAGDEFQSGAGYPWMSGGVDERHLLANRPARDCLQPRRNVGALQGLPDPTMVESGDRG